MIDEKLIQDIQAAYEHLERKQQELVHALQQQHLPIHSGWYNGHYRKKENGEWQRDAYPIPVITIEEICDIELSFDGISLSARLTRDDALAFPFEKLASYQMDVYGIEHYLSDFYHGQEPLEQLTDRILAGDETEIGFSFSFAWETPVTQLVDCIIWLKQNHFYQV